MYFKFKVKVKLGYTSFEQKDTLKHCLQFITFNKSDYHQDLLTADYLNTTMREELSMACINLLATYFKITFKENYTLVIEEK